MPYIDTLPLYPMELVKQGHLAFLPFSQVVQIGFFTFIISGGSGGEGSIAYAVSRESWNRCFITCNIVIKAELYFRVHWRQKGKWFRWLTSQLCWVPLPNAFLFLSFVFQVWTGIQSGKFHVLETWYLFGIKGRHKTFTSPNKMIKTVASPSCFLQCSKQFFMW